MERDYKVEIKITLEHRRRCIDLFGKCEECSDIKSLKAFASVKELSLVEECIPKSDTLDYNILILALLKNGRTTSEPALLDLLDALARQYQYREDHKGKEFEDLKEEIRKALLQGEGAEQERVYLRLVEDGPTGHSLVGDGTAQQWIEEAGDDVDELALRITLAVFNGATFEIIERAKGELSEMLRELVPPPAAAPPPAPPDPKKPPLVVPHVPQVPHAPHVPLMRRLEKAGAKEAEGKPPDWRRGVELEKPELAGEAVLYVWQLNREAKWRQKLIEWLTNHAAGRSADARTRAAVAVGRLALKDYRFVRDRILTPWVRKDNPQFRTAVGMVLGVLVREESMAEEVQRLLVEWSESTEAAKRWAAMRAYIYVGAYCRPYGVPVARWRAIAASEPLAIIIPISEREAVRLNNPLHMSLMDAMVRFFVSVPQLPEEERRPLVGGILGELKKWIDSNDDGIWLGLFLFTTLGQLLSDASEDGESDGAPLLLQLLEEGPDKTEYRRQLAGLLELAMRNGTTIVETEELICAWLGWVDKLDGNSQLYETRIRTLFEDIIDEDGGSRMRGKLAVCLRDCGRNQAARRILAGL